MPVAVDKLSNRSVCTSDIDYFVDMPGQSRRLEDRDRHPPLNSDIHMTDNRPGSTHHPTCSRARKHTQFKTKGQTQFKSFDHVSVFNIYIRFFHFSAIKSDVIKYRVDQCYKHVSTKYEFSSSNHVQIIQKKKLTILFMISNRGSVAPSSTNDVIFLFLRCARSNASSSKFLNVEESDMDGKRPRKRWKLFDTDGMGRLG